MDKLKQGWMNGSLSGAQTDEYLLGLKKFKSKGKEKEMF